LWTLVEGGRFIFAENVIFEKIGKNGTGTRLMMNSKPNDMPLFEIRARRDHPATSHAECLRQNKNLSAAMKYALRCVRQAPGLSARELEKRFECEAGTVWKVAAQLERRGLITRRCENSRTLKLYPSSKGMKYEI
jgi:uncharacterized membrane protein